MDIQQDFRIQKTLLIGCKVALRVLLGALNIKNVHFEPDRNAEVAYVGLHVIKNLFRSVHHVQTFPLPWMSSNTRITLLLYSYWYNTTWHTFLIIHVYNPIGPPCPYRWVKEEGWGYPVVEQPEALSDLTLWVQKRERALFDPDTHKRSKGVESQPGQRTENYNQILKTAHIEFTKT